MKKVFFSALFLLLCVSGTAFAASPKELKEMSTFLSNFTELRLNNISASHVAGADGYADAIYFGIRHNYVNNFRSSVSQCKNKKCPYGNMTIKASKVAESIKRYFGIDVQTDKTADFHGEKFYFDGDKFHFEGAAGETAYFARIKNLSGTAKLYTATGVLYNSDDPAEPYSGTFTAHFKSQIWHGKKTYVLVDIKTKSI